MIYNFLFPSKPNSTGASLFLLALRIFFGLVSLGLAIFGELVCSMAFIVGVLYRLAMLPMIFTMGMAFFVIHGNDAFAVKELALIYLVVFILMYISGPGKFSVDYLLGNELRKRRKNVK